MKKQNVLKINQVNIDEDLYPRNSWNWLTSHDYAQSMRAGAKFPPIVVALFKKKYYLIDGRHRIEAIKTLKEEYIQVDILTGLKYNDMYLKAVELNIGHGRALSPQEKTKIILKLKDMKLSNDKISKIVNIPIDKLQNMVSKRLTNTITGQPVVLKAPAKKFVGVKVQENFDNEQSSISAGSGTQALKQVITMFENEMFDYDNVEVMHLIARMRNLVNAVPLETY